MGGTVSAEQKIVEAMASYGPGKSHDHDGWKTPFEQFVNHIGCDDDQLAHFKTTRRLWESVIWLVSAKIERDASQHDIVLLLGTCIRLLATRGIYDTIPKHDTGVSTIFRALNHDSFLVRIESLRVIERMITCHVHVSQSVKMRWEAAARLKFCLSKGFEELARMIAIHLEDNSPNAKVVLSQTLSIFAAVLTNPASSGWMVIRKTLKALRPYHRILFRLAIGFDHGLRKQALVLIQAIILHSHTAEANKIQQMALSSGAWLWVFYQSVNTSREIDKHSRWFDRESIGESRILLGLLSDNNREALNTAGRILPREFLAPHIIYRAHENQVRYSYGSQVSYEDYLSIRTCRWQEYASGCIQRTNWTSVMALVDTYLHRPELVWNATTKMEMLDALLAETEDLKVISSLTRNSNWDYPAFEVIYHSLKSELRIGNLYIRLLLPLLTHPEDVPSKKTKSVVESMSNDFVQDLANKLFRHVIVEDEPYRKLACFQTIKKLLRAKRDSVLPIVNDYMGVLVKVMTKEDTHPINRDCVVLLLKGLMSHGESVRQFICNQGVKAIINTITKAHKSELPEAKSIPATDGSYVASANGSVVSFADDPPGPLISHQINFQDGRVMMLAGEETELESGYPYSKENRTSSQKHAARNSRNSDYKHSGAIVQPSRMSQRSFSLVQGNTRGAGLASSVVGVVDSLSGEGYKSSKDPATRIFASTHVTDSSASEEHSAKLSVGITGNSRDVVVYPCERPGSTLSGTDFASLSLKMLNTIFDTIPESIHMIVRRHPMLLRHVIQLMCVETPSVQKQAMHTTKRILQGNRQVIPHLAETGFFLILLTALNTGCVEDLGGLLEMSLCVELSSQAKYKPIGSLVSPKSGPATISASRLAPITSLLPPPLLAHFKDQKAIQSFLTGDRCNPSVIWGPTQRDELHRALSTVIDPLRRALTERPTLIFHADTNFTVGYPSIEDEVMVGDVYLRLLVRDPTHNLHNPDYVAKKLMIETSQVAIKLSPSPSSSSSNNPRIRTQNQVANTIASGVDHAQTNELRKQCLLVIQAQLVLCNHHFKRAKSMQRYGAFTGLMSLLMRVVGTGGGSGGGGGYGLVKEDMEICLHVIHLIQALIEDGSASGGGAENIDLFLKADGLRKLTKFLLSMEEGLIFGSEVMAKVLSILQHLGSKRDHVVTHASKSPKLVRWMVHLLDHPDVANLPDTCLNILRLLQRFATDNHHPHLLQRLLRLGTHFYLCKLAMFPPAPTPPTNDTQLQTRLQIRPQPPSNPSPEGYDYGMYYDQGGTYGRDRGGEGKGLGGEKEDGVGVIGESNITGWVQDPALRHALGWGDAHTSEPKTSTQPPFPAPNPRPRPHPKPRNEGKRPKLKTGTDSSVSSGHMSQNVSQVLRKISEAATKVIHHLVAKTKRFCKKRQGVGVGGLRRVVEGGEIEVEEAVEAVRAEARVIFQTLLTPGLYRMLTMPKCSSLWMMAREDHYSPTLVWNHETRTHLKNYLTQQIQNIRRNGNVMQEMSFSHKSLSHYLVINDIYIQVLNKQSVKYRLPGYIRPDQLIKDVISYLNSYCASCLAGWRRLASHKDHKLIESKSSSSSRETQDESDPLSGLPNDHPTPAQVEVMIEVVVCLGRLLKCYPRIWRVYQKQMRDLPLLLAYPHPTLQKAVLSILVDLAHEMVFTGHLKPHAHLAHALLAIQTNPRTSHKEIPPRVHKHRRSHPARSQPQPRRNISKSSKESDTKEPYLAEFDLVDLNLALLETLLQDPVRGVGVSSSGKKSKSRKSDPSEDKGRGNRGTLAQETAVDKALVVGGVFVSLCRILCERSGYVAKQRRKAAQIIGHLAISRVVGKDVMMIACAIFSFQIKEKIMEASRQPAALVDFYDDTIDSPLVYWSEAVRSEISGFVIKEHNTIRAYYEEYMVSVMRGEAYPKPYIWKYKTIRQRFYPRTISSRLYVGGLFIDSLVTHPYFKLKSKAAIEILSGIQQRLDTYLSLNRNLDRRNQNLNPNRSRNGHGLPDYKHVGGTDRGGMRVGGVDEESNIREMKTLLHALTNMVTNLPHTVGLFIKMDKLQLVYRFFWDDVKNHDLRIKAIKLANACAITDQAARHVAMQKLVRSVLPILVSEGATLGEVREAVHLLLLHVRRSSAVIDQIRMMGGLVILGWMVVDFHVGEVVRERVASLIGAMTTDSLYGQDITNMMCQMLTANFKRAFQSRAKALVDFIDRDHSRGPDGRKWNARRRQRLQEFLHKHARALVPLIKQWDGTTEIFNTDLLREVWDV